MVMRLKPWADVSGLPSWIRNADGVVNGFHGGSRVTVKPAPTDTDDDYVVLVQGDIDWIKLGFKLAADGWHLGGSAAIRNEGHNIFQSWKKGDLNVITTCNGEWFEKMLVATKVCMALNIPRKEDRIMVFEAVVYALHP